MSHILLQGRSILLLTLVAMALPRSAAVAQNETAVSPPGLTNQGFEHWDARNQPVGWNFGGRGGGTVHSDASQPFADERSARIDALGANGSAGERFSNLMQSCAAEPWRGKKARFRAAVRTGDLADDARVQMWFRVDRKSHDPNRPLPGAFDNMQDRPIETRDWKEFEIVLPVADDAVRLNVGIFVIGRGQAWVDEARLEIADAAAPTTAMKLDPAPPSALQQIPPAVQRALANAQDAPQQPFFTHWLWLAALAMILSFVAMWPAAQSAGVPAGMTSGAGRFSKFAFRFALLYWVLYCFPNLVTSILPVVGVRIRAGYSWANTWVVQQLAQRVFGLTGELVPPNGSGDTTYSYLTILSVFSIAIMGAVLWSLLDRRPTDYRDMRDLLRSYLRYSLAFAMLGYGLAKVSLDRNQFPELTSFQLDKTWGNSSPMNVLWAFMGASRPYTIFAGLGEVLAAVLLVWRRTAVLGALVSLGVMSNVLMLNYCYDVPVKIYSTHLVVMAVMIMLPDARRLLNLLVLNRTAERSDLRGVWRGGALWWVHAVVKTAVVVFLFAMPLSVRAWHFSTQVSARTAATQQQAERDYLLTNRGFRWINEVPFNR